MIEIESPKAGQDWNKIAAVLTETLCECTGGNFASLLGAARKWRDGDTKQDLSQGQMAGRWIGLCVAEAASRLLREDHRLISNLSAAQVAAHAAAFVDAALEFDRGLFLEAQHLIHPAECKGFDAARAQLPAFIDAAAPGHSMPQDEAVALFNRCIAMQMGRAAAQERALFDTLEAALAGSASEPARRELAWARHEDWIRGLWEREHIFLQEERPDITLSRVYIPLRCFWHAKVQGDQDEREAQYNLHLADLHHDMTAWLEDEKGDPIRIIAGTPGCGKSTFARKLAADLSAEARLREVPQRVLLVRLQHLRVEGGLETSLTEHLKVMARKADAQGGEGLPDNPLDMLGQTERLVLIFDGLDELSHDSKASEAHATRLMSELRHLMARGDGRVRALVLGRAAACQEAARQANVAEDAIRHVLPLRPVLKRNDRNTDLLHGRREIADTIHEDGFSDDDQRLAFFARTGALIGMEVDDIPALVTDDSVEALTSEPLLLYLMMYSGHLDAAAEAPATINEIYAAIFKRALDRDLPKTGDAPHRKDHAASDGLTLADKLHLMECLGLAAWQANTRTGTDADFDTARRLHGEPALRNKAFGTGRADIRTAAVQFYARAEFGEGAGFEFVHKSFGEYLVARALVSAAREAVRRREENPYGHDEIARWWAQLIGAGELTDEIMHFLGSEVLSPEDADSLLDQLEPFLRKSIQVGFPLHGGDFHGTWRERADRERCAAAALLAVTSWCARACTRRPEGKRPVRLRRFRMFPSEYQEAGRRPDRFAFRGLERLEATGRSPVSKALAHIDLSHADLAGVSLPLACLDRANLCGAIFTGADLTSSSFVEANLFKADLFVSDLSGSCFSRAKLIGADLGRARMLEVFMNGAILESAHLANAELDDAVLEGVELGKADLHGASLRDASMRRAKLRNTDMGAASLVGANLQEADMREANLHQANLNGAHLQRAILRGADLSEANLKAADLRNADLKSAVCTGLQIQGAHMEGADLRQVEGFPWDELMHAIGDAGTKLPEGVERPASWTAEEPE